MAPSFRHGKSAYFTVSSATGGTINLSSGINEVTLPRSAETAEVTTFGDSDKNYIVGLRDASISVSGHFASTYDEKLHAMLGASTLTSWVFGPESTANARRKLSGSAILTSYEIGAPVGDKVSMSLEFQCSGTITATTF